MACRDFCFRYDNAADLEAVSLCLAEAELLFVYFMAMVE